MHGICFDYSLQEWFDFKIPKKNPQDFIFNALQELKILKKNPRPKSFG
jgi:hypothetical protein